MTAQLKALYREASDFFIYVHGYAPNIPTMGGLNLHSAIDRLFDYLDRLSQTEDDPLAKQWLRLAWSEMKASRIAFDEKEDRDGRRRLEMARAYLQNAQAKKPMKPTFIVGEPGFSE